MAISSTTVWEVRTTGAATGGAGFDPAFGGTDYSQQDAAQYSPTDLATAGADTTLLSVAAGFTAAMVGNLIRIASGTNFTAGWYQITAFTDASTVTLDRTPATGVGALGVGYVGGASNAPWTIGDSTGVVAPGNTVYVKAGTYTLTGSKNFGKGTGTTLLITEFIGYATTRADGGFATVEAGAFTLTFSSALGRMRNFVVQSSTAGAATSILTTSGASLKVINCKILNTSATGGSYGLLLGPTPQGVQIIGCEIVCTNGSAVKINTGTSASNQFLIGCYIHDSAYGVDSASGGAVINCIQNVIETCSAAGIYLISTPPAAQVGALFLGNTIYNCTKGISTDNSSCNSFIGNIIDSCPTVGAEWVTSNRLSNMWMYNNFHGNGTDRTLVTAGATDTAMDPGFVNAAGGDFSVGSAMASTGYPRAFLGAAAGCVSYTDQGAVQRRPLANRTFTFS